MGITLFAVMFSPSRSDAMLEHHFLFLPAQQLTSEPSQAGLEFSDVTLHTSDNLNLHAWWLPGKPDHPALLFCHGNAGNISDRIYQLRFLNELGLSVLIFDYRGYGRSEGEADEEGTYTDARAALAWLRQQGWTDDRIFLYGRSLGAAVAVQLATENKTAGVILETPFTSIADMGWRHYPLLYAILGWLFNASYDNFAKIGQIESPLLIIHGAEDEIVPVEMARNLLTRTTNPKQLYIVPNGGHNDLFFMIDPGYRDTWGNFVRSNGTNGTMSE